VWGDYVQGLFCEDIVLGMYSTVLTDDIVYGSTEYIEYWPCPLFDILLNKYYPAG
jgi:hypothetical protein